jgi:Na+/melibiose symporter-like transporter
MTTTGAERTLSGTEKRELALLGLPTFGLALSITVVSTYLPVVAKSFTGSTVVIGLVIGAEGVFALFVPLLVGTWSDQLRTRIGGRLPFVIAGVPFIALALSTMGFTRALLPMVVAVAVFFLAYFVAYEPYRAMYPDLMGDEVAARTQSSQAIARGAGTGLALLCGGLLMAVAKPLPFVVAALLLLAAVGAFLYLCLRRGHGEQDYESARSMREALRDVKQLLAEHPALRWFMAANALWELSLGALKTFIVLFLTAGIGMSLSQASLAIGATAVFILGAAAGAGKLGDRFGKGRVMRIALWIYGLGLLVPFVTQSTITVAAVPFVAIGGGVIMALPYALLMPLMPETAHGTLTGYYSLSRGLGTMLGPILGGIAVQIAKNPLASTKGYAAVFLVCSLAILASVPMMRRLRGADEDRAELRAS